MAHVTVVCEDGEIRHAGTFDSMRSARRWADWGHCCLSADSHRLVVTDEVGAPIRAEDTVHA